LWGSDNGLMKISVSKDADWEPEVYAKAPLELLLCEELQPNTKLLWIVLANQSKFGPVDKSVLDKMIGIHRSTRIRCIKELREFGLVKGTEEHLILINPAPVLRKLIESTNTARAEAQKELLGITMVSEIEPKKTPKAEKINYLEAAKNAWNAYRPANYSKVNVMSSELIKAIDSHITALKLKPHCYEEFFSVLKVGVEHSPFWSRENSSKNLQSIIGIGSPQSKKYQNVYMLYNEGLNHERGEALREADRKDELVVAAKYRSLIDDYDELQFMYYELSKNDPASLHVLDSRIIETEERLRDAKLDPARFRMKYQIPTWPTDVPEPETSRERFWRYDDEK
jgi:hypothetical protein